VDIRLCEPAFTAKAFKGRGQTFRQSIEHAIKSLLSTQPESERSGIEKWYLALTLSSQCPGTQLLRGIYLAAHDYYLASRASTKVSASKGAKSSAPSPRPISLTVTAS